MVSSDLFGRERALEILEAAVRQSPADATEIVLLRDRTALTRFANSEIHQNVSQDNTRVSVRAVVGRASARVCTAPASPRWRSSRPTSR